MQFSVTMQLAMFLTIPDFTEKQLNLAALLLVFSGITSFLCFQMNIKVPYGRYATKSWGIAMNAKFAWLLQESPAFFVPFSLLIFKFWAKTTVFTPNVLFVLLFMVHYFRRSFIYPLSMKQTAPTPVVIALMAFSYCTLNSYIQAYYLLQYAVYTDNWFYSPQCLLGVTTFIIGFTINVHSDNIVTNLRRPGETGYKIPKGGVFEYVSGANFFGEIVEWGGFALASSSFVAMAFFISTILNIGPRAVAHHRFYQEKFEDYPKSRKALIPFIF